MDKENHNNFNFSSPAAIPLSWRPHKDILTLRQKSEKLCVSWSIFLSKKIRECEYYNLILTQDSISVKCLDLFIEKTLYLLLLPITRKYCRLESYLIYGHNKRIKQRLHINDFDLFILLSSYREELNLNPDIQLFFSFKDSILNNFRKTQKIIYNLLSLFILKISLNYQDCGEQSEKIGIEVNEGLPINFNKRSELNWWEQSSPSPDRIVCLLKKVSFSERDLLFKLYNQGTKFFLNKSIVKRFNLLINNYWSILSIPYSLSATPFANAPTLEDRWLKRHYIGWKILINWWYTFFKKNNIKIWLFITEHELNSIAQREAIGRLNGISIFRQRSECVYEDNIGFNPADIVLTWNQYQANLVKLCRNRSEFVLPIGHSWGIHSDTEFGNSLRKDQYFKSDDIKFVIAIIDNVAGLNNELSFEQIELFYSEIFSWTLKQKDIALLIKKKKKESYLFTNQDFYQLKKQKRLLVFETRGMLTAPVAKAADLVIGMNISSAAIEGLLLRKTTLFYYPSSSGFHPLEKLYKNIIVFDDIKGLMSAIKKIYRKQYMSIPIDEIISIIDDYNGDGKGPLRLRQILKFLLQSDLNNKELLYSYIKKIANHV